MDAAALAAELLALSDAGGSYEALEQRCYDLCSLWQTPPLPSAAAAEDAVRAVVAALMRNLQHAQLQVVGCITLATLVQAAPAANAAAGADGVVALFAALHAHAGNVTVLGAALAALMVILLDVDNRETAGAAGGAAAVVAVMTQHPADLNIAARGCLVLARLAMDHPRNAAAALVAGVVPTVLAAMRAFPAGAPCQALQLSGALALVCIVDAAGTLGGAPVDDAAYDAAVAAMRAFFGNAEMQYRCCAVLAFLFRTDRNADAAWVRRGGVALTVATAALRAHRDDANGCSVIKLVMMNAKENQRGACVGGVFDAVVAAMRAFPAEAELQMRGCEALCNTCYKVRDNQLAAAAAGGLEVAVSAMRAHTSHADLQFAGCAALCQFAALPFSQTRVGELGGVELVLVALRARSVPLPADSVVFFTHWTATLSTLLREHPINRHKAVAAGSLELLMAHMCAPAAGTEMFDMCCNVLGHLISGGADHTARAVLAGALEALEAQTSPTAAGETDRLGAIRHLQPAAQRHDAEPCAVDGCKRCAAARRSGGMCALPGCGARGRDGAANKKLLRCGTCRAACYCGAAHQREDWRRHKGECGAPARDDDEHAAGASGR
jgi:hypothetical protein